MRRNGRDASKPVTFGPTVIFRNRTSSACDCWARRGALGRAPARRRLLHRNYTIEKFKEL
jgi:hypothetical protein